MDYFISLELFLVDITAKYSLEFFFSQNPDLRNKIYLTNKYDKFGLKNKHQMGFTKKRFGQLY